eukprot:12196051-Alexandrium_andersonii.AAC.1
MRNASKNAATLSCKELCPSTGAQGGSVVSTMLGKTTSANSGRLKVCVSSGSLSAAPSAPSPTSGDWPRASKFTASDKPKSL